MISKKKILEIIDSKGKTTTRDLLSFFDVSRQYINQLISELITEKQVIKIGSTRSAFYVTTLYAEKNPDIVPNYFKKKYKNESLEEHRVLNEIEKAFLPLAHFEENIKSIFTFAFSEMFNNAIEHSQSKIINVEVTV